MYSNGIWNDVLEGGTLEKRGRLIVHSAAIWNDVLEVGTADKLRSQKLHSNGIWNDVLEVATLEKRGRLIVHSAANWNDVGTAKKIKKINRCSNVRAPKSFEVIFCVVYYILWKWLTINNRKRESGTIVYLLK